MKAFIYFLSLFVSFSLHAETLCYQYRLFKGSLIHIIEVDPTEYEISLVSCKGLFGLQTIDKIAENHQAEVAINAGFFYGPPRSGAPSGALKINGSTLSSTSQSRGAIGWSQGGKSVDIDRLDSTVSIQAPYENKIFLNGLNRFRKRGERILYTSAYADSEAARGEGAETALTIFGLGSNPQKTQNAVYTCESEEDLPYSFSSPFQVDITFSPLLHPENRLRWNQHENILGSTPLLVSDRKVIRNFLSERTLLRFLGRKCNRTAVGILPNGHWIFVVVEEVSENGGIKISNLAKLMHYLGATRALNLDGGKSSSFYYRPLLRNTKRELREIGNALIVKKRLKRKVEI